MQPCNEFPLESEKALKILMYLHLGVLRYLFPKL